MSAVVVARDEAIVEHVHHGIGIPLARLEIGEEQAQVALAHFEINIVGSVYGILIGCLERLIAEELDPIAIEACNADHVEVLVDHVRVVTGGVCPPRVGRRHVVRYPKDVLAERVVGIAQHDVINHSVASVAARARMAEKIATYRNLGGTLHRADLELVAPRQRGLAFCAAGLVDIIEHVAGSVLIERALRDEGDRRLVHAAVNALGSNAPIGAVPCGNLVRLKRPIRGGFRVDSAISPGYSRNRTE